MMSADYMDQLKRDAAKSAKRESKQPELLLLAHKEGRIEPRIPSLGEFVPKGWVEADLHKLLPEVSEYQRGDARGANIFFVDSSGFGAEGELALTVRQFLQMAPAGFGYAVVEVGQFQVCVKAFVPPKGLRTAGRNYDVAIEA